MTEARTQGARPLTTADRLDIHELIARYNWAIDERDASAWAGTFTADGVFDGVVGVYRGTAALRQFIDELSGETQYGGTQHWVDNVVIDGAGDEATMRCHHALIRPTPGGGGEIVLMAEYRDRLRQEDGRWRFALRRVRRVDLDDAPPQLPL